MITIPDDYADLLKNILDCIIIEAEDTSRVLRALENVLDDIFENRNNKDWYYNLQYAKEQLQKVRSKTI